MWGQTGDREPAVVGHDQLSWVDWRDRREREIPMKLEASQRATMDLSWLRERMGEGEGEPPIYKRARVRTG